MHLQRLAYGRFRHDVNVTWNLGPHDVSIMNYLAGRMPARVRCAEYLCTRPNHADVALLTLDYDEFSGHAHLSCVDPMKVRRATVAGAIRGIVYDDVSGEIHSIDNTNGRPQVMPLASSERPLDAECRHFAECVLSGAQPRTGGIHASEVVAVLEAATASAARDGEWVTVDNTHPQSSVTSNEEATISPAPQVAPMAGACVARSGLE
jgi:predicted dehydrogenase